MPHVETYRAEFFVGVKSLREEAFPNDPPWDRAEVVIPAKLATQPELFLVAIAADSVVGAALTGYDGHRGWLYSVAVSSRHQRAGLGLALVRAMEGRLRGLGCVKINLQGLSVSLSQVRFYHKLGYSTEDCISMGKRLSASR